MQITISSEQDITNLPEAQQAKARNQFYLWSANKDLQESLLRNPESNFLTDIAARDKVSERFVWDTTTGSMVC